MKVRELIRLARPKQQIKNCMVALPLVFLVPDIQASDYLMAIAGVAIFICLSGAVYCNNDISDALTDIKSNYTQMRPLATGTVSRRSARVVMVALLVSGISLAYFVRSDMSVMYICGSYLLLNFLYTNLGYKRIFPFNLFIVSAGFSLRFQLGIILLDLPTSFWALFVIFLFALVPASGKRVYRGIEESKDPEGDAQRLLIAKMYFFFFCSLSFMAYSIFILLSEISLNWASSTAILSTLPILFVLLYYSDSVLHHTLEKRDINERLATDRWMWTAFGLWLAIMVASRIAIVTA